MWIDSRAGAESNSRLQRLVEDRKRCRRRRSGSRDNARSPASSIADLERGSDYGASPAARKSIDGVPGRGNLRDEENPEVRALLPRIWAGTGRALRIVGGDRVGHAPETG